VCELNRLFLTRYRGDLLPDDDDGRDSIQIMIHHLAMLADPNLRIADWLRRCAPWFPKSEAEPLITAAIRQPLRWKADTLAERLNLTDAERSRLKIRTIGAADCTKERRAERRREKNRLARKAKRHAAGAKPQSESISRTRPAGAYKPKDMVQAHGTTSSTVCIWLSYCRQTCAIAARRIVGAGTKLWVVTSRRTVSLRPPFLGSLQVLQPV
jgi:hypothetical protein